VSGAMEEKDREFKRARTVRTDYKHAVDEVQSWIQNAEFKVQDRSVEPLQLKENLSVRKFLLLDYKLNLELVHT
jgi:nesprin-1